MCSISCHFCVDPIHFLFLSMAFLWMIHRCVCDWFRSLNSVMSQVCVMFSLLFWNFFAFLLLLFQFRSLLMVFFIIYCCVCDRLQAWKYRKSRLYLFFFRIFYRFFISLFSRLLSYTEYLELFDCVNLFSGDYLVGRV